jgi:hypothetical protein
MPLEEKLTIVTVAIRYRPVTTRLANFFVLGDLIIMHHTPGINMFLKHPRIINSLEKGFYLTMLDT